MIGHSSIIAVTDWSICPHTCRHSFTIHNKVFSYNHKNRQPSIPSPHKSKPSGGLYFFIYVIISYLWRFDYHNIYLSTPVSAFYAIIILIPTHACLLEIGHFLRGCSPGQTIQGTWEHFHCILETFIKLCHSMMIELFGFLSAYVSGFIVSHLSRYLYRL